MTMDKLSWIMIALVWISFAHTAHSVGRLRRLNGEAPPVLRRVQSSLIAMLLIASTLLVAERALANEYGRLALLAALAVTGFVLSTSMHTFAGCMVDAAARESIRREGEAARGSD